MKFFKYEFCIHRNDRADRLKTETSRANFNSPRRVGSKLPTLPFDTLCNGKTSDFKNKSPQGGQQAVHPTL